MMWIFFRVDKIPSFFSKVFFGSLKKAMKRGFLSLGFFTNQSAFGTAAASPLPRYVSSSEAWRTSAVSLKLPSCFGSVVVVVGTGTFAGVTNRNQVETDGCFGVFSDIPDTKISMTHLLYIHVVSFYGKCRFKYAIHGSYGCVFLLFPSI